MTQANPVPPNCKHGLELRHFLYTHPENYNTVCVKQISQVLGELQLIALSTEF
jgi:hypothetical protein